MAFVFGAKTDVGRKRVHNEDSLCADPTLGLFVVCDGLGGHNSGEIASALAVQVIQQHLREASKNRALPILGPMNPELAPQTNRLASAVRLANQVVHGAGLSEPNLFGMATTVVCALINGPLLSVAHAGDSRLYLVRGATIRALTVDHSLVAEQVRQGILTEEQAERSVHRNIVTRALGARETLEVDLNETELVTGDCLLLCSDGLTRGVSAPEILRVLKEEQNPEVACDQLIDLANAAGGEDNTTVIVVRIVDVGSDERKPRGTLS
jgi:protein phosphatase